MSDPSPSETLLAMLRRLAAICASDDARALPAPWMWTDGTFLWNKALDHGVLAHGNTHWPVSLDNREVIASARNRLSELARVLEDAARRIDLLESLAIQDGLARDLHAHGVRAAGEQVRRSHALVQREPRQRRDAYERARRSCRLSRKGDGEVTRQSLIREIESAAFCDNGAMIALQAIAAALDADRGAGFQIRPSKK